jgi:ubiquinone/menaquinone biosynthesis C-methylase UbiE
VTSDEDRRLLAGSFESAADIYARVRPEYAPAAIEWTIPKEARSVLDLAAGTGKLTAGLVGRGLDLVAIDPSAAMLAQLTTRFPGVDARVGSAEAIDLPSASVDLITVGSALHWFDRPAADFEMARVLRPGGVVAVFANSRDRDIAWVRAFDEIMRDVPDEVTRLRHDQSIPRLDASVFGPFETRAFANPRVIDAEQLVDLAASRSYVITMAEPHRRRLLGRVRELTLTHPELAGQEVFELPYRTVVWRAVQTLRS